MGRYVPYNTSFVYFGPMSIDVNCFVMFIFKNLRKVTPASIKYPTYLTFILNCALLVC